MSYSAQIRFQLMFHPLVITLDKVRFPRCFVKLEIEREGVISYMGWGFITWTLFW